MLRERRQSLGWTQEQLADSAGYSKRLVQKAEAGGSLAPDTIAVLAEALSRDGRTVSVADLIATPESVVRALVAAINEHQGDTVAAARDLLDDEFTVWSAGDPAQMPFAGTWAGLERASVFFHTFFKVLTPAEEGLLQNPRFLADGGTVVCWAEARARVAGVPGPMPDIWAVHRYAVRDGKVRLFENHFDTQLGAAHFAEARARELLKEHAD